MNDGKTPLQLRLLMGLAVALVWSLLIPPGAHASIVVTNYMEGSIPGVTAGPELYAYHSGQATSFTGTTGFDQGTYSDTEVDTAGILQLAGPAATTWWDADWEARRCFDVSNPSALGLSEHQVRIVFDSTSDFAGGLVQLTGADYRAVANDNVTLLDLWVEGGVGTAETIVWVQLDLGAVAVTTFCLYFDNPLATTVSSSGAVFSYSTPRQLYYPNYWRFDGSAGVNGRLDVVSFVDGNSVTVAGTTQVLNEGQVGTFFGVDETSVITVTGPIAGRGQGGGMDSIVPVSFAGTDMVFPTNRSSQRWTLVAPSGLSATVEIYNGTALAWSGTINGIPSVVNADVTGGRSGIIRSTNGVPIIVTHTSASNSFADSILVPPFFPGDDIYGVRSRASWIGFAAAGSVDIFRSDGTSQTLTGGAGSLTQINDPADFYGDGTAIRLTNMSGPTGALQQADGNGYESTSYLPERLLENEYYLPSQARYVAFSCPVSTNITVGATVVPCNAFGNAPGHGWHGVAAQGTKISSDNGEPFFAYYEDLSNSDETNLFGMKSAQSYTDATIGVTGGLLELLPAGPTTGTWTSPIIDTAATGSNVFGLLNTIATLPPDTDVSIQIARAATPALAAIAPFLGPDGTTATSFDVGETPAPFAWDFGDQYVIARITLDTTAAGVTPLVDSFSLGYDLPVVSVTSTHLVVTDGATSGRDWILRAWTQDPVLAGGSAIAFLYGAQMLLTTSTADLALGSSSQIQVTAGTVTQTSGAPVAIGPGLPHNVIVDTTNMSGVGMTVIWQATLASSSIHVPHRLQISFT